MWARVIATDGNRGPDLLQIYFYKNMTWKLKPNSEEKAPCRRHKGQKIKVRGGTAQRARLTIILREVSQITLKILKRTKPFRFNGKQQNDQKLLTEKTGSKKIRIPIRHRHHCKNP